MILLILLGSSCPVYKMIYYADNDHVLRTQTSHQEYAALRLTAERFIASGDVYCKDTIDKKLDYPVFPSRWKV